MNINTTYEEHSFNTTSFNWEKRERLHTVDLLRTKLKKQLLEMRSLYASCISNVLKVVGVGVEKWEGRGSNKFRLLEQVSGWCGSGRGRGLAFRGQDRGSCIFSGARCAVGRKSAFSDGHLDHLGDFWETEGWKVFLLEGANCHVHVLFPSAPPVDESLEVLNGWPEVKVADAGLAGRGRPSLESQEEVGGGAAQPIGELKGPRVHLQRSIRVGLDA
mmetsp:Transcript_8695/g.11775  ORF Transcript_8695/g.11775 Transcript_8695/m.11775 type:complete len:217 (-) Transcript_8695:436-1086(-)|eukprot:CAMPEP_0196601626 /NCGR_PEP_ID=MMETSP1081-20130531/96007_1 /TAXON_ID=36882 /ORGANISM="Pyramimonas amylifera, Strain CCMP720" /LENGTH=216 /DNA_ID=CAMNT_0041927511 /DNA_START=243 /DNA_END=893 /DNA_ORIENTATION=+